MSLNSIPSNIVPHHRGAMRAADIDPRGPPDTLENGVPAEYAQYGVPMVADSPLGHDMLGGRPSNCEIKLEPVNQAQNCEKRSGMPTTLLVCDATTAEVCNENNGTVELTNAELEEMETILAKFPSVDDRYPHHVPKNT
ncbi:hypothetical protein DL769_007681 [Monosporascus sp. CRB-8-3]|nr:hypothetical protein DL769_007681 [Monosporascus sp. CRB-8-3]